MRTATLAVALLLCCSGPIAAQSVKVEFRDGKVDIHAQNATVRAILQEWGKQGGTRIINGERIPGAPVTLELVGAYENQALEILLRGVSGYVVGPRQAGTSGASGFDRILILPTSNAPRGPSPTGQAFSSPAVPQPFRTPIGDDPDDDVPGVISTQPNNVRPGGLPNPRLPPPGVRQRGGQVLEQNPQGLAPGAAARDRLQQIIEEDLDEDIAPEPERPAATPQNPFGVVPGSMRPGVISPVPPPQQRPPEQEPR
jgi:hypothetical protein